MQQERRGARAGWGLCFGSSAWPISPAGSGCFSPRSIGSRTCLLAFRTRGPFNQHFVRDVGAAFVTIGVAFLAAAPKALARRGVLLGATLFYVLHSLVHVADLLTGRLHANHWGMDLPLVFLPTMLLIFLALPIWWPRREAQ